MLTCTYTNEMHTFMTQINFKIDKGIKKQSEKICKKNDLTLCKVITMFLEKIIEERRIPFDLRSKLPLGKICADPFYSNANISELERRVADIKDKKCNLEEHDLIKAED